MIILRALSATLALTASVSAANVQLPNINLPADAPANRDAVRAIFLDTYNAYRQFAFGHDDLAPVTKGFVDGRNGWAATIIDSMSTMLVMGFNDTLYREAINYTHTIDFSQSKTDSTVSVFETTIRYVGGFLSAYELGQRLYGTTDQILLDKATQVADKMTVAWVGNSKIPHGQVNFKTNVPQGDSGIAEAGTLALEWFTLTKYTNNSKYADLGVGALKHIAQLPAPLPGLPAQGLDPITGNSVGGYITWGGGSDSYFEYLIKFGRLSNTDDKIFVDSWKLAVDSSIRFLAKRSTVGNHLYLADYTDDRRIRHVSSHLACFHGGNWITGGKLVGNDTIVQYGLELTDACWNTYASTATGIGPEAFGFISADGDYNGGHSPTPEDLAFYNKTGFYVLGTASYYYLRPEVLESNFIAWRATGDKKYYDRAAAALKSFQTYLKAPAGYAGIEDVRNKTSAKINDTESFFYAEVLKYLFLTFDDPSHIDLDDWVFNTECHPLLAPDAKPVY